MSDKVTIILSRTRTPRPGSDELEREIVAGLAGRPDVEVLVFPHLNDLSPTGAAIKRLRSVDGDLVVLGWLYPRAIFWMLQASQVHGRLGQTSSLPEKDVAEANDEADTDRTIWCFDLSTHDEAGPYLGEIAGIVSPDSTEAVSTDDDEAPDSLDEATNARWYPVIDFSRCTNCLECLNFCLFGVFGLDEASSILIEQPDACRAGCPACSRICPEGAIMFPEHQDPAIAGDAEASLEGLKLDLSQLFAGASPAEIARIERAKALVEQQGQGSEASKGKINRDGLDELVDELDDMDL